MSGRQCKYHTTADQRRRSGMYVCICISVDIPAGGRQELALIGLVAREEYQLH